MLKISYYFNTKEVWEGLQRAGDTTDSSGSGTFDVSQHRCSLKTTVKLLTSRRFGTNIHVSCS